MGITWGLPARWHPDEKADVALQMARETRLAPDSFINPSLPLTLMAPPLWVQAKAAEAGWLDGIGADPFLVGRALAALAGAATVFLLGLATRPSLLPPLLLALTPGFVNLSHFATPEPWLLLATATTLFLAVRHLDGRFPAWALGLALGLAASTKYTAASLAVPILVVALWRACPERARPGWLLAVGTAVLGVGLTLAAGLDQALAARLRAPSTRLLQFEHALGFVVGLERAALITGGSLILVALLAFRGVAWARRGASLDLVVLGATAAVGFLLGTPGAALEPRRFLTDLAYNYQTRFEYKGLVGEPTSYLAYLGLLSDALTLPVAVAAGLGALVAAGRALRGEARWLVWLTAALAPYLLVASSGHRAMRFLAPALPASVTLVGAGLSALRPLALRHGLAGLLFARAALGTVLLLRLFFVDSRLLASRWMERDLPPGAVVDLIANHPGYAPTVPEGCTLHIVRTLSREMAPPERFAEAAARYHDEAAPWLVLTAAYYQRFLDHPEQHAERGIFFRELLEGKGGFDVVARFKQRGWLRPPAEFLDPEIVILKKRDGG